MNYLEVRGPRQLRVRDHPEGKQKEMKKMKKSVDRIQMIKTRNQKETAIQLKDKRGIMVGVYWSEVFHRAFGQSAKHITDNVFQ